MPGIKFQLAVPNFQSLIARAQAAETKLQYNAGRYATDLATRDAQMAIRQKMSSVGLGKLGNAVGQTSALKKRQDGMWGVIYAKGHTIDDNRGAGALEAYSRGVIIRARNVMWLAFATDALPKMATAGGGRQRMTPQLYQSGGWASSLGPLIFKPISSQEALLVVRNVSLSPKTGRAKKLTGRTRTRIPMKETVVFILIRWTARAQRFDEKIIVAAHAKNVPEYIGMFYARNRF